jgi:hypothetical protein
VLKVLNLGVQTDAEDAKRSGEWVMETVDVLEVRTAATAVDEEEVTIGEEVELPSSAEEDEISLAGASTTTGTSRSPPFGIAVAKVLKSLLM